ncbi:coiled-coil domain-containing protein 62 isoform X8 [Oxyura jamaicensis]|uniref:coiled-coil domain-containing protein 62 isoform X8 n=1 Tax=Oxyura jamaicensis TaxID=8884 RepID=UPI0015A7280B|nr:coiled-coil domain-containing protein 62 isoform X8 [Oxyura jamaicensis]
MNPARPRSASPQKFSPSFENSTVEKQRRELQVLIAELKAREEELNAMVAVHQRERLAWEDDRQKILTLAERCALLNNELNKRNDIIKSLTKKLKLLESQQSDSKMICEITQQKFEELSQKLTHVTLHCQGLEEENQILRCSVLKLSAKKGQLQAREQELLKKLELKGEDILETTDYVTEFTSKFKLESALHAAKAEEFGLNKEKQDLRLRLRELILETDKLKDDLCEKIKENNKQQEEIIHLKQENVSLKNELALNVEKAKRKDQLLQFAKSKQVRTDTELSSLREIYVKQQRDLQFLHVNLENSQELRQKHEKVVYEKSGENFDLNSFHLDSPCFLTSTQKGDRSQRREKFSDANSPLDIGNLSVTEPKNRCCDPSIHKDACYPTSKLQPALAESQQMVADLELSTLLHMSLHCSPNSSSINTTTELAETSQDAVIWYRRKRC